MPEPSPSHQLVNLTPHPLSLSGERLDPTADDGTSPDRLELAASAAPAVLDDREGLPDDRLRTGDILLSRTLLARGRTSPALPAATPGVQYVVPHTVAYALRRRGDLLFPLGETVRADGVVQADGLAQYRSAGSLLSLWRDHRGRRRLARARRPLPTDWRTGLLFALATAALSGALGLLPGAVDGLIHDRHTYWLNSTWTVVSAFSLLGIGVVVLGWATLRWRNRTAILESRGTAYIIQELAISWHREETAAVLFEIGKQFAATLHVAGPSQLGYRWQWATDWTSGSVWDDRLNVLVHSFWSTHYNDDHDTQNAVFVWAPWPVALAFGARAIAGRRGLVFHIRQRPSSGVGGGATTLHVEDTAHSFTDPVQDGELAETSPRHHLVHGLDGTVEVTFQRADGAPGATSSGSSSADTQTSPAAGPHDARPVVLLIVRFFHEAVGPFNCKVTPIGEPPTIRVAGDPAADLLPPGTRTITYHEWRYVVGDEDDDLPLPQRELPWAAFPAVVDTLSTWICTRATEEPESVFLLAGRIPQEIAVGLGITMTRRSSQWPTALLPVVYQNEGLTVPSLDLGSLSIPTERH